MSLARSYFALAFVAVCVVSVATAAVAAPAHLPENDHEFNLLRDVKLFEVVTPKLLTHFESQNVNGAAPRYADHLEYGFQAYEKNFLITLEKNKELFSSNYVEQRYGDNGVYTENRPNIDDINCHYWGKENRSMDSNVAISTCDGLRGLITSQGVSYFIEPAAPHSQKIQDRLMGMDVNTAHIVYRIQDMSQKNIACGVGHNFQTLMKEFFPQEHKFHAQTEAAAGDAVAPTIDSIGVSDSTATPVPAPSDSSSSSPPSSSSNSPSSAPTSSSSSSSSSDSDESVPDVQPAVAGVPDTLYVELLMANDNARYRSLGANTEAKTAAYVNMMNNFYSLSNLSPAIRIVLVGQLTYTASDPYAKSFIGSEVDINRLLSTWNNYHTTTTSLPRHDAAQLLTSLNFYGNVIGYAPVGTMCQPYYSGGIIQATYGDVLNAMVAAHEMGHNFGMQHDGNGNTCAVSGSVMYSVGCLNCNPNTVFSQCSKNYYASWVASSRYKSCLYNVPA